MTNPSSDVLDDANWLRERAEDIVRYEEDAQRLRRIARDIEQSARNQCGKQHDTDLEQLVERWAAEVEYYRSLANERDATIERLSAELERVKRALVAAERESDAGRPIFVAIIIKRALAALTLPQTNYERSQSVENGGK